MPDSDIAGLTDLSIESPPWLQVRVVIVPGKPLQVIERPPILHDEQGKHRHAIREQPLFGPFRKVFQHLAHAIEYRPPHADLEGLVDPHPDHEYNDLVAEPTHVGHVATL
jgi:hypothetical protein